MKRIESMRDQLPMLGVGLGFRPPFRADLFLNRGRVDFLEITADHYFDASPEKRDELDLLADHFTLIPHGLDLSIGSAEGLDPAYLEKFAAIVERVAPPWCSEHLAFTRAGGISIGHLATLPYTNEAVDVVVRNFEYLCNYVSIPFILENVAATVLIPGAEFSEPAFLTEVLNRTGCGWLCDVTNLYTNAVNQKIDMVSYFDSWPWDRVVQMHLAGGHRVDDVLIDSHAYPVAPEVWRLLDEAIRRSSVRGILLERDERLPAFSSLLDELEQARTLLRRHGRWV